SRGAPCWCRCSRTRSKSRACSPGNSSTRTGHLAGSWLPLPRLARGGTRRRRRRLRMERGWTGDGSEIFDGEETDREVFRRVFGYLPAPGVRVPRFTSDWDMATAVLRHVEEAWRPLSVEVKRR